jgi:hypothetical protein
VFNKRIEKSYKSSLKSFGILIINPSLELIDKVPKELVKSIT